MHYLESILQLPSLYMCLPVVCRVCCALWQVRADVPAEVRWAVAEKVISDVAIVSGVAGWAACGCAVLVQSPQRGLPRVRPPTTSVEASTCVGRPSGVRLFGAGAEPAARPAAGAPAYTISRSESLSWPAGRRAAARCWCRACKRYRIHVSLVLLMFGWVRQMGPAWSEWACLLAEPSAQPSHALVLSSGWQRSQLPIYTEEVGIKGGPAHAYRWGQHWRHYWPWAAMQSPDAATW